MSGRVRGFVAVAVLLGAVALVARRGRDAETVAVRREDLVVTVDVTGTLQAVESDLVGPPLLEDVWEFKIAMLVPEGSAVKKGQPLVGFDATELQRFLKDKQAESEQARKELEKKETDLRLKGQEDALKLAEARARLKKARLKVEVPAELVKAKEIEQARFDADLAEREIAWLESRLTAAARATAAEIASLTDTRDRAGALVTELEAAIGALTVTAPRDGVVIYKENWRGEKKKVGDACWRAEVILEIPDVARMRAEGEIDEADAGRVAAGQAVRFRLDAHPDLEYSGKIESVAGVVDRPTPDSPQRVVRVKIAVGKTDPERMRPGMRLRGTVEVERERDVLVLPGEALLATATGPVALRRGWLGSRPVAVRSGRRDGRRVEILSGLAEGERVAAVAAVEPER